MTIDEVVSAGLELSPDDRAEAVRLLQAADNEGGDRLGPGWLDEIKSRMADIRSGKAVLVDPADTYRQVSAELAARR